MSDLPRRIYLQPACCAEGEIDGRRWSEERWEECDCEDPQQDVEYVFSRVMPSPAELDFRKAVEAKAAELYDARWREHPDYRPWFPGGNATAQDDARAEARRLLTAPPALGASPAEQSVLPREADLPSKPPAESESQ